MHLPIFKPIGSTNLAEYVASKRGYLTQRAFFFGAILFRGWDVPSAKHFENTVDALDLQPFDMSGSAAPRTKITRSVYTSNDAPPSETIPFHHELGQSNDPPSYIFFYCETPSSRGGATPIVDSREIAKWVRQRYPSAYRKIKDGLHYRRVMPNEDDPSSPIGRSWKTTFGTDNKTLVEERIDGQFTWCDDDELEIITPLTSGVSSNKRGGLEIFRNSLVAARLGWNDSRNNGEYAVRYGDGSVIPEIIVSSIEERLHANAVTFEWEKGDVLMIDNSVTMHSRQPFEPPRRILASIRGPPNHYRNVNAKKTHVTLPSWDEMPRVGYGCWQLKNPELSVLEAIRAGYRHIDTASDYGNEWKIGDAIDRAIKEGIVSREDLWITSKLSCTNHGTHVKEGCFDSMRALQVTYLDLYMMHFPISLAYDSKRSSGWTDSTGILEPDPTSLQTTWREMERLVRDGYVKNIGLCNVPCVMLQDLMSYANLPPSVLQVEIHPYNAQPRLLEYCKQKGIRVVGFSPLGDASYVDHPRLISDPAVLEISRKYNVEPATVLLSWADARVDGYLTKSEKKERLIRNLHQRIELTVYECETLDALDRRERFNDPGAFLRDFGEDVIPI